LFSEQKRIFQEFIISLENAEELIEKSFPDRTKKMIETIEWAKNRYGSRNEKFALIFLAGPFHLIPIINEKIKKKYDLTPLYEKLNNLNAQIIIPFKEMKEVGLL
jgi:predicted nucleotide-binding protein (sugar kinase/HSP70/actin superfamily)